MINNDLYYFSVLLYLCIYLEKYSLIMFSLAVRVLEICIILKLAIKLKYINKLQIILTEKFLKQINKFILIKE